ncbi:MAG: CapA family protein [Spirochaetales bacterium]
MNFLVLGLGAESPPRPLRLAFIGDIMAHDVNFGMNDYGRIYSPVSSYFKDSDYAFGQLEFVVDSDRPWASYPRFNVHTSYVESAIDSGLNVFSIANNHTTDYKSDGVLATRESLSQLADRHRIHFSGARGESDGRFEVTSIEWEGKSIGVLAITRILNDHSGSELTYYVPHAEEAADGFLDLLEEVTKSYDLFILSVHDGTEYRPSPDSRSRRFYRRAVDAGVDILWGHHPHVLQPWELVEGEDGRRAVIMPSLGNFVSGQTWRIGPAEYDHWRAETGDSAVFRVSVAFTQDGATVSDVDPVPITHYHHPDGGVTVEELLPMRFREDVDPAWRRFYRFRASDNAGIHRRYTYEHMRGLD